MLDFIYKLKNKVIVSGHYGSGKTNFSVNLAKEAAALGKKVTIIDLDIVNPYFRTADNKDELEALGIKCIIPDFANTNVDIPSLPPTVMGAIETANREPDIFTIIDVGGDGGAVALGMFSNQIIQNGYDMLYVINMYRPLTESIEDAKQILREIEYASRLTCTGIVNNSNIGIETTTDDIIATGEWADSFSKECALPIICTSVDTRLKEEFEKNSLKPDNLFYINNATKQIF